MLDMSRRAMLAGTLASAPAWPLPNERPAMSVEDLAACVRHAFELTETDAWLVGQRLIWSTGSPRHLVIGVAATMRASAMMRGGIFNASEKLPESALLAVYTGSSPGGAWRPVTGGTVTLCGVRMAAFASHGRSACLLQPRAARIPSEIVVNG